MGLIDSTQNIDKEMEVIANLSKEKETTKEQKPTLKKESNLKLTL